MSETTRNGAHSQENDEALNAWDEDKWEAQEAINRAAIAKEHGFKPWGGFAPSAPPKTPPLSKEEQEKAKTRQQEALQRWLDEGLPKAVPVATMPEKLEEVPTPGRKREVQPTPQPEARPTTAEAVQEAISRSSEHAELTEACPLYIINRQLANCRVLTSTERCCIGLLNSLMQKHGYAFVSNEQLALWLCMKTNSVRNMLAKLSRQGFIQDTGRRHLEIRWVVRVDLQNPKRKMR